MPPEQNAFDQAVADHDSRIHANGLPIWMGAEPTFTDRFSEAPEWLTDALGSNKEARARDMLANLSTRFGRGLILRTLGRQYPGEERPRWSLGLYSDRDAADEWLWSGPPDPVLGGTGCEPKALESLWRALIERLNGQGWLARGFRGASESQWRIAFRCLQSQPATEIGDDPRLARPSIHASAIPLDGLSDDLAAQDIHLVILDRYSPGGIDGMACIELPAFDNVSRCRRFLQLTADGATEVGLQGLVFCGFTPPVDDTVSLTTLTPDPAVVEVNMAPSPDAASFLNWTRIIYAAADTVGLAPYRLQYNGTNSDSGGGGHVTLGGPSPAGSPFFLAPQLLPNLIRYFNRHPSLSYWFARQSIGSSSQSPRPDEQARETFEELGLALDLLSRDGEPGREILWASLAPFLSDAAGNTHRSELNIEKLWNPYLPGRGCLGLVEFRPFHMASSPEALTSLVVLMRALTAMLARPTVSQPLTDWGPLLHDRYTLPFYLRRDLREVMNDLQHAGLGLGRPIREHLLNDDHRLFGSFSIGPCTMSMRRALEPWPLVGDVASQERGTSRLVDSSTTRVELLLRADRANEADLDGWELVVDGCRVALKRDADQEGPVLVLGLRYRSFTPWRGLHPTLPTHGPLTMTLVNHSRGVALDITLHDWIPGGGAYAGLPVDQQEARRRCAERFVVVPVETSSVADAAAPAEGALTEHCLDLRRLYTSREQL